MRATRATSVAFVVIAVATAAAAMADTQSRDTSLPPRGAVGPSGTGVLSGVVTTGAPSRQPVRRATIRLAGAAGTSARLVGTDDEGRFVFEALPAGTFTLSAAKPGYVEAFHGSKRPGRGPGVPIAMADGQRLEVALELVPGAVITGTIIDARGNPAPEVPVAVVGVGSRSPGAAPMRGVTDDRGVYRIFGLAPGEYVVSALPRLGVGSGRGQVSDIVSVTDAEVQWARGARSGAAVGPAGTGTTPMPPPGRPVTYAPVFYPGTTDVASAATISVGVGEERAGIGFALQVVPTARLAGTIVDANGQPVTAATVSLYPRRRDQPLAADALVTSGALTLLRATVSATGFSIPGVVPGEYTVVARSGSGGRATAAAPPSAPPHWSVRDLVVDGRDQSDLVLRLTPGLKLSGTIVFEQTSLAPPADMSAIDLVLQASGSSLGAASTPRARVDPGGAFVFSSIVPWAYSLTATPPGATGGARWTLKSAILDGHDLADGAFEVPPGNDVTGLVITFTDRAAAIAGRLVDAGGRPVTAYSIVVFPADRAQWLAHSRRIRAVRPATDGAFTVAGLPAGEYAVAAAEDVIDADLSDPAFLARLLLSAHKLTLAEAEQKRQDLRIGGSSGRLEKR